MYKVFFVDDEIIVRDGIRSCLAENERFLLTGEAQDGELALSMIHEIKPDILITDIKMPFMNGLELSRIVKKIQPWVKIIILSGHDEFEYAKEAISIGIEDYLLKPFTQDDLFESLNKIALRIEEENKKALDIARLKAQVESNTEIIKDRFLSDFVLGSISPKDFMQQAENFSLKCISRFYTMCILKITSKESKQFSAEILFSLKTMLKSLFEQEESTDIDAKVLLFSAATKDRLCLMVLSSTEKDADEASFAAIDALKHKLLKSGFESCGIGIGTTVDRLAQVPKSFSDAEKALHVALQNGSSRLISADDLQSETAETLLNLGGGQLVDMIKYALVEEIDQIINQQVEMIDKNPFQFTIVGSYLIIELITACSRIIEQLGGNVSDVCPEVLNNKFVAVAVSSVDSFMQSARLLLSKVLEYRDNKMNSRYGSMILKAKKYIDENHSNQDICLRSVADEVAVSPNHFSAVFSQECGQSFIEYLTSVRIEHAKKLLNETDMRSSDIAYEVGFNDPHYFSFIFKKNTGFSPKEFRQS